MKINWKVRFGNKTFWVSFIPAVILVIQAIASVLGFSLDLGELGEKLILVVDAVFGVLVLLGVVADHTTAGLSDSVRAMTYTKPM